MLVKNNPVKRMYYYVASKKLPLIKRKSKSKIRTILNTIEKDKVQSYILFQMESDAIEYMEHNGINYKCQEKNGRSDTTIYDYNKNRISYIVENDIITSCGYG